MGKENRYRSGMIPLWAAANQPPPVQRSPPLQQTIQSSPSDEIWRSFRELPALVILWMSLRRGPIDTAGTTSLSKPKGGVIASVTTPILDRGNSNLASGGYVFLWTLPVLILAFFRSVAGGAYAAYLTVLLAADLFLLVFVINQLRRWLRRDHQVMRHGGRNRS